MSDKDKNNSSSNVKIVLTPAGVDPNTENVVQIGQDENENELNPWVANHQLPVWWICLVVVCGR